MNVTHLPLSVFQMTTITATDVFSGQSHQLISNRRSKTVKDNISSPILKGTNMIVYKTLMSIERSPPENLTQELLLKLEEESLISCQKQPLSKLSAMKIC